MVTLNVNGKTKAVDVTPDTPLLWTLRDVLAMTGTKFGCGQGLCGACTIHIDGRPTRSCITPVSAAVGKKVTTIEAIGATPAGRKALAAWLALDRLAPSPPMPLAARAAAEPARPPAVRSSRADLQET